MKKLLKLWNKRFQKQFDTPVATKNPFSNGYIPLKDM